jgi:GH43 family beta-xylosidase
MKTPALLASQLFSTDQAPADAGRFQNPIAGGADPWVVRHEGWYYWCLSENMLGISIYRSRTLTALGEKISTWRAPRFGAYCAEIWAPELHFLDGQWYIYVAASNGANETHRMIVLETEDAELLNAAWRIKAELYTGDEIEGGTNARWAIDGTVLAYRGRRYFIWSGWEANKDVQFLYLAEMSNPWTVSTNRVRICSNTDFAWERVDERNGRGLNEGPQVLERNGRIFVIYSASASWEPAYKLGGLQLAVDGDPMNPAHWHKIPEPVFQSTALTWGVGHCCFVKSSDGAEDWIAFHAKLERKPNWNRAIYVQRFGWTAQDTPDFGAPVAPGVLLSLPSGEHEHASRVT